MAPFMRLVSRPAATSERGDLPRAQVCPSYSGDKLGYAWFWPPRSRALAAGAAPFVRGAERTRGRWHRCLVEHPGDVAFLRQHHDRRRRLAGGGADAHLLAALELAQRAFL